jgi:hypothetical protein
MKFAKFILTVIVLSELFVFSGFGAVSNAADTQAEDFDWRAFLAPFHKVTLHLSIGFVMMGVILEFYSLFRPG